MWFFIRAASIYGAVRRALPTLLQPLLAYHSHYPTMVRPGWTTYKWLDAKTTLLATHDKMTFRRLWEAFWNASEILHLGTDVAPSNKFLQTGRWHWSSCTSWPHYRSLKNANSSCLVIINLYTLLMRASPSSKTTASNAVSLLIKMG